MRIETTGEGTFQLNYIDDVRIDIPCRFVSAATRVKAVLSFFYQPKHVLGLFYNAVNKRGQFP
jgi:hypothetical protein